MDEISIKEFLDVTAVNIDCLRMKMSECNKYKYCGDCPAHEYYEEVDE